MCAAHSQVLTLQSPVIDVDTFYTPTPVFGCLCYIFPPARIIPGITETVFKSVQKSHKTLDL